MSDDLRLVGSSRDQQLVIDVAPGAVYEIAVVPRSFDGGRGRMADAARTHLWARGRRTQPGNVATLTGHVVQGVLVLQWSAVAEPDVAGYEIKAGPRWTGGLPIARGVTGTVYVAPVDWIGDRTFRVKAVNRMGIVSDYEATAVVSAPSTHFADVTSHDEHNAWDGTKTAMLVVGDYLELDTGAGLTGTYESEEVAATSVSDRRLFVSLECDIVDVTLTAARLQVRGDAPYLSRRMGDELTDWEGSENNDFGPAAALLMPGDDFYLDAGNAAQIFDFQKNGVTFLIEYRTSDDAGATWSDWAVYQPGIVANCDTAQARVTVTTVHKSLVPRLRTLSMHLADPVHDSVIVNDEWSMEWRFDRVVRDPNTGTFGIADVTLQNATLEAGHSAGINMATAQTTKIEVDFRVPEDLDLAQPITAEVAGRLSGAPAATANLRFKYVARIIADNQVYASGGSTVSAELTTNIGSTGTAHASADLAVLDIGEVFAANAIGSAGREISASIIRLAAASSDYGGTFLLTRFTLRGKRKKR